MCARRLAQRQHADRKVSDEKQTALGLGRFVERGDDLPRRRGRRGRPDDVPDLKFKPPAAPAGARRIARREAAAPAAPAQSRDNAFFWQGVRGGRAADPALHRLPRRCAPAGSMCPHCQSLDWDAIASAGRGHVSASCAHHRRSRRSRIRMRSR